MLTRLKVQNYKSLRDIDIGLNPLTVFVGPNNAGKSNILDCLNFLKELAETSGGPAVESRGGFRDIVWNGDLKRSIQIELDAVVSIAGDSKEVFNYQLGLSGGPTHFTLEREILQRVWTMGTGGWIPDWVARKLKSKAVAGRPGERITEVLLTKLEDNQVQISIEGEVELAYLRYGNQLSLLQIPVLFQFPEKYRPITSFVREINGWAFYEFVPQKMREPNTARRELKVNREGENISAVIHSLQSEFGERFEEIADLLKSGIPEVRRLFTRLTEQGKTYVSLEEKGLSLSIPAWAISEGTLRLLAHLAIVSSPEAPTLACFEEPENCIHPHLLELVVDVLKSSSKRMQVLITTHSPYLLNLVRNPESLIVVEKGEGETVCKPVKDEGVKEALQVLGLGELWYSGNVGGVP
ncbi:MAG: AAA family ATPase [Candidatus Rokubacteria bacterium]|nr:AAA family ATPase [Candidatus Rokubacteria bacterium]